MVMFGLYELESDLRDEEFKKKIKEGYEKILL